MEIKKLTQVITDYLSNICPMYAIMINGPWGCGKTHFIKSVFNELEEKMIYVSLYGVCDSNQIEDRLLTALTSIDDISEKDIGKAGQFLGSAAKIFSDTEVSTSSVGLITSTIGTTIKSRLLGNINKERCLVFDDLERAEMDATKTLSFINNLVEHQEMKVIILCDESKLHDKKYKSYKEKVVLFTNHVEWNPEELAEIAFSGEVFIPHFLKEPSKHELAGLLGNIECLNLRTINYAVSCYSKLLSALHEDNHELKENLKQVELIYPCLAFAIGYKDYGLSLKNLRELSVNSTNMGVSYHLNERSDDNGNKTYEWGDFYKNVVLKDNKTIEITAAFKIVCEGLLDYEALTNDISSWDITNSQPVDHLIRLNYNVSDEEFSDNVAKVIHEIKNDTLILNTPSQLISLCSNLYYLVDKGAYPFNLDELEKVLTNYVTSVLHANIFEKDEFHWGDSSNYPFVKELTEKIVLSANEQGIERSISDMQTCLLSVLNPNKDSEDPYKKLYGSSHLTIFTTNIIDKLTESISEAKPEDIYDLSGFISSRYSACNIFQFLGDEVSALKELKDKVNKHAKSLDSSLTKFQINLLYETLGKALEKEHYGN